MDNYEIIFESERINYCKISESLINEYLTMINDPNIGKCISSNPMTFTYEQERNWICNQLKNNELDFSMIDKETGKFIGNISLKNVKNNSAEVGITVTPKMQDKHYGTEAITAMVNYARNILKISDIYLYVFDFNKRAIKCYENCGFVKDGPGKETNDFHMTYKGV